MNINVLTLLSTYLIVFLCELGDKTQLAVLLFTCNNPRRKWSIFLASSLALTLCVTVEVTIGLSLARYIGPVLVNKIAGGVFLLLGMTMFYKNLDVQEKLIAVIKTIHITFRQSKKSSLHIETLPISLPINAKKDL